MLHWANADLLTPIGEKHTGTRVSRKYDLDEVRKAAILRELSRFGLTVTVLDGMGAALGRAYMCLLLDKIIVRKDVIRISDPKGRAGATASDR